MRALFVNEALVLSNGADLLELKNNRGWTIIAIGADTASLEQIEVVNRAFTSIEDAIAELEPVVANMQKVAVNMRAIDVKYVEDLDALLETRILTTTDSRRKEIKRERKKEKVEERAEDVPQREGRGRERRNKE